MEDTTFGESVASITIPDTSATLDLADSSAWQPICDLVRADAQPAGFLLGFADNYPDFFLYDAFEGTTTLGAGELVVDKGIAESCVWELGTVVTITFEDTGPQAFTVVGIATGPTYAGVVAMSERDYEANFGTPTDAQLYVKLSDGVTLGEGKLALEALAEDVFTAQVQTFAELRTDAEQQINQLLGLFTRLLGLAVLISLIGVTNTMAFSVIERTREIGLLRAVGMDRRQTRRMIRSEASIISIFGALLGVVIGIFFGWAILQALEAQGFTTFVGSVREPGRLGDRYGSPRYRVRLAPGLASLEAERARSDRL